MAHRDFSAGSYPHRHARGPGAGVDNLIISAGGDNLLIAAGTDVLLIS